MKKFQIVLISALYFLITSCASNHHLVFFTNTTIGVEIGSEPSNGSPAKFIVGYKRQEGVIDPLIPDYEFVENNGKTVAPENTLDSLTEPKNGDTNIVLTPQGTALLKGANNRAHSVLAKMNFGATGGGSGASAAQFFATGRAADYLAQSENIAGALAGDPQVNQKSKANLDALGAANYSYIHYVYRILYEYIKNNGPNAAEALSIKTNVDNLDIGEFKKSFKEYSAASGHDYNINNFSVPATKEFRNVLSHVKAMAKSLDIAKKMIVDSAATGNGSALTTIQRQEAVDNISEYPKQMEIAEGKISGNQSVVSMITFVHKNILLGDTKKIGN